MKVSIIVPVYNCENYIKKCIDSLINQTYKNIEIIVVDDGSTDSSYKILKEYKNKIKLIHQENHGVSFSRNKALEKATGEYVMFVDIDDWIDIDMVEKLYRETNNGKIDIVRCGYIREYAKHTDNFTIMDRRLEIKEDKSIIYDKFLKNYDLASPWGQIIKKDCIKIKFDENVKVGEDYLFNLDVYTNARSIILLPECYYHYLYNDNSATTSITYEKIYKRCEDAITVYSKLYEYLQLWNIDTSKNIEMVSYRILKELNMKLITLFKIKKYSKKEVKKIIFEYLNNNRVKKISKNVKIKTIFNQINIYSLFIFLIKFRFYNLYYIFASTIYTLNYNKKSLYLLRKK